MIKPTRNGHTTANARCRHTAAWLPLIAIILLAGCHLHTETQEYSTGTDRKNARPTQQEIIMQTARTSRLYTAEYHVHKIVTHDDIRRLHASALGHSVSTTIPLGDRKIAIPIDVTLRAYIDFSDFSDKNIEYSADSSMIHVILPDPKVVVTASKIDHKGTRQYIALLRSDFTDAEISGYARQGEESIIRSIPQIGILQQARESAASTLIPLISQLGYGSENIVITFRKQFSANDLPQIYDNEHSVVRL